jgi:hypothetical protein
MILIKTKYAFVWVKFDVLFLCFIESLNFVLLLTYMEEMF